MGALDIARAFGLHEVELPEPPGFGAKIRPLEVDELLRSRTAPSELRREVVRLAEGETPKADTKASELPPGAVDTTMSLLDWQVAAMVRALRSSPTDEWEPVTLTPALFGELPPRTQAALRDIAEQRKTPAMVTALVRRMRGEITEDEAVAIFLDERPKLVSSWDSFRNDGGRPGPGADGAEVEPQPEQLHPGDRPRRRPRARPGAGDAADSVGG